jgi:phospholipid N-methyltransferase
MGAILPATQALASAMAETAVNGRSGSSIVEIGAGSGKVTDALLRHSHGRARIRAIEANQHLAERLRQRLPAIDVVSGRFEEATERIFAGMHQAIVVSSVPLFSLHDDSRSAYQAGLGQPLRAVHVLARPALGGGKDPVRHRPPARRAESPAGMDLEPGSLSGD